MNESGCQNEPDFVERFYIYVANEELPDEKVDWKDCCYFQDSNSNLSTLDSFCERVAKINLCNIDSSGCDSLCNISPEAILNQNIRERSSGAKSIPPLGVIRARMFRSSRPHPDELKPGTYHTINMALADGSSQERKNSFERLNDFRSPGTSRLRQNTSRQASDDSRSITPPKRRRSGRESSASPYSRSSLRASDIWLAHQVSKPVPHYNYNGYQFMGDENLLNLAYTVKRHNSSLPEISYCAEGQKIENLVIMLRNMPYSIYKSVIVMIGTNDLLQDTDIKNMISLYKELLQLLKEKAEKIVLITLPPIPKQIDDNRHWEMWNEFNDFISGLEDGSQIFVVDAGVIFVTCTRGVCKEYYEGFKSDLSHCLNEMGLELLKCLIEINYFED